MEPSTRGRSRPPTSAALRREMVAALERSGAIQSDRVRRAFLAVPRERFVPEVAARDGLEAIYQPEAALATATDRYGQPISSSSAPSIMAGMLEALDLHPGMRVLEVGAGTGYNAALLSRLVGPRGRVVSVDVEPSFVRRARKALTEGGHRVRVVVGDGRNGWPRAAPFDRIIVTASSDTIPVAWRDQLVEGGLVELPFRYTSGFFPQSVVTCRREGSLLRSTCVIPGGFMALRDAAGAESPMISRAVQAISSVERPPSALAWLSGSHLETLSEQQRQRVLATVLGRARRRLSLSDDDAAGLSMFLGLHRDRRLVNCSLARRFGVGLVGRRGASFAAVLRTPGERAGAWSWAEPADAWQALTKLIDEWKHMGRPALRQLEVTVAYGAESAPPRPWRRVDAGDATVALTWAPA